jgi:hypothetical protein
MKVIRYLLAGLLGFGTAAGVLFAIGKTGLYGMDPLPTNLYSSAIVYPTMLLSFGAVFWIVFALMDRGTGH